MILRDYFQENRTSKRPFLLLRISFPGRPIFIQFVPALVPGHSVVAHLVGRARHAQAVVDVVLAVQALEAVGTLAVEVVARVPLWRQLYKIGLPGKLILKDCFQENMTCRIPFLLLRISFPGRTIFIQFIPVFLGKHWRQLYRNRSSRKINSQRLFSRE